MPIVAASNGIKPYIRALAVIKLNQPVSPSDINACVGTGDYAAKYISKLRKDGFEFTSAKDGREIVSYTLVAEPSNAAYFRGMQPKVKGAKKAVVAKPARPAKTKKPKVVVTKALQKSVAAKIAKSVATKIAKSDADIKAANLAKMKAVTAKVTKKAAASKRKIDKLVDEVENAFGSTGDITGSAVDAGWDSMDGIDVKNFLR
jgi:hypothetical protein